MHAGFLCGLLCAVAAPPPVGSPNAIVENCVVSLIEESQVPAKEAGQLVKIAVKEGDAVSEKDLLANLASDEAEMRHKLTIFELRIAEEQATNDISVQAARATHKVAVAEHESSIEINKNAAGAVTPSELRRLKLTAERAQLQIAVAEMEFKIAGMTRDARVVQVDAAKQAIEKRMIIAPQDGLIAQVYRNVGEWVQAGDPLLHIVRIDRLRVEGFLNVNDYSPLDVANKPVTVEVRLARGIVGRFPSKIGFVSPIVQANGDYRVWCEVENRKEGGHWVLRPGLDAAMTLHLDGKSPNIASR